MENSAWFHLENSIDFFSFLRKPWFTLPYVAQRLVQISFIDILSEIIY